MSNGPLNRPKLPGIPGIDSFKGHTFHTSRWDYGYTGGDTTGNLHKLADKRVAIIGTGATAVQCVPYLAKDAQHLYVFQRTPSSVDERGNSPTDPEWVKTLTPGWQKRRMDNFNILVSGWPARTRTSSATGGPTFSAIWAACSAKMAANLSPRERGRLVELADFKKMNQIRARVDAIVKDKRTAEALKPWYRQFCKRPTFNDEYLPAFNRPNVTLVDTQGPRRRSHHREGPGVRRRRVRGGLHHLRARDSKWAPPTPGARASRSTVAAASPLTEHWAGGLKTLHGFYSFGFPNCFHMGITQNALDRELSTHARGAGAATSPNSFSTRNSHEARCIEPTAEAEAEWVATIKQKAVHNRRFLRECTPGYYNNEGQPAEGTGSLRRAIRRRTG